MIYSLIFWALITEKSLHLGRQILRNVSSECVSTRRVDSIPKQK